MFGIAKLIILYSFLMVHAVQMSNIYLYECKLLGIFHIYG